MFLKPAHSNLCCPQASPSGRIRHPRARPTRRIVASSLLCVRGAEVESKPQRLEQRSPAIQGGSNWISLAMVKPKCPRPARNRKPRSTNWNIDETNELLNLRFQTEDIFIAFLNQDNKDDEKNNWKMVSSRLSTNRDWEACRSRLKTLTAQYKKLMKEDTRTGNLTEDAVVYPPYWGTMIECLGPFSGLNGKAIADSESNLATACSAAVAAAKESEQESEEDEASDQSEDMHAARNCDLPSSDRLSLLQSAAAAAPRLAKRPSVFSPAKEAPSKRTKKDCELSSLASSVTTLVQHIVGKSESPQNRDVAEVQAGLASVQRHVTEVGGRVADLEEKIDAVAEKVAASVTKAVLVTITTMFGHG
ncbi:hypothetical protein PF003_g38535 [Phytophthora fragariae]|nr:hypothetical protein PF003_g38535 [Phytophthora fragariae]